jgi:hypothetical protein
VGPERAAAKARAATRTPCDGRGWDRFHRRGALGLNPVYSCTVAFRNCVGRAISSVGSFARRTVLFIVHQRVTPDGARRNGEPAKG